MEKKTTKHKIQNYKNLENNKLICINISDRIHTHAHKRTLINICWRSERREPRVFIKCGMERVFDLYLLAKFCIRIRVDPILFSF
jgi:hypothetical protein